LVGASGTERGRLRCHRPCPFWPHSSLPSSAALAAAHCSRCCCCRRRSLPLLCRCPVDASASAAMRAGWVSCTVAINPAASLFRLGPDWNDCHGFARMSVPSTSSSAISAYRMTTSAPPRLHPKRAASLEAHRTKVSRLTKSKCAMRWTHLPLPRDDLRDNSHDTATPAQSHRSATDAT
jgi:hypothetical protein